MEEKDDLFMRYEGGEDKKAATKEDKIKGKYGEDSGKFSLDKEKYAKGMVREGRKCTDIFCLAIFIAFLGAMGYATAYGLSHGNIEKLIAPISSKSGQDSNPVMCGIDKFKDYPLLYFSNMIGTEVQAIFDDAICVKSCPTGTTAAEITAVKCMIGGVARTGTACVPAKSLGTQTAPYATHAVGPFCLPESYSSLPAQTKDGLNIVKKQLMSGQSGKLITNFVNAKSAILISFGMGFVYSLIFLYLMSAFAEQIAWFCVFLVQIGLLGGAAGSFMEYTALTKKAKGETGAAQEETKKDAGAAMTLAVVFGILTCCFFACVCCGKASLQAAIDVIDAAADFTVGNKRVIFVPIVYFVISFIFMLLWIGSMACVASLNDIKPGLQEIPQNKDITWTAKTRYMGLFMLFGILWILAFLDYTSKFIVMASAATYYFNSGPGKPDGEAELGYAIKIAHLNHAGSIAFGSFIIALVRFIEIVFMYLAEKAEQAGGDNPAIKAIVCIGQCILKCIEKIVDYINEAAFAYICVSGDNFCMGAWNGFLLNVKHCLKFSFANGLAKVFILLGKVALTVGNCFSLMFIIKHVTKSQVTSATGPVVVVAVVSFFTASLFLGIFETAVMALMTCYSVDLDLHDGKCQFGPETFRDKADDINAGKATSRTAGNKTGVEEPLATNMA